MTIYQVTHIHLYPEDLCDGPDLHLTDDDGRQAFINDPENNLLFFEADVTVGHHVSSSTLYMIAPIREDENAMSLVERRELAEKITSKEGHTAYQVKDGSYEQFFTCEEVKLLLCDLRTYNITLDEESGNITMSGYEDPGRPLTLKPFVDSTLN